MDTEGDECCSGPMTGAMAGEDGSRWIGISNIGDILVARVVARKQSSRKD